MDTHLDVSQLFQQLLQGEEKASVSHWKQYLLVLQCMYCISNYVWSGSRDRCLHRGSVIIKFQLGFCCRVADGSAAWNRGNMEKRSSEATRFQEKHKSEALQQEYSLMSSSIVIWQTVLFPLSVAVHRHFILFNNHIQTYELFQSDLSNNHSTDSANCYLLLTVSKDLMSLSLSLLGTLVLEY